MPSKKSGKNSVKRLVSKFEKENWNLLEAFCLKYSLIKQRPILVLY
jgi:hypothetical protein